MRKASAKRAPVASALATTNARLLAMRKLVDTPSFNRVCRAFDLIEVAEQEIAAAKRIHPEARELIDGAFLLLVAPSPMLELRDSVYRSHARELLERVVARAKLDLATEAEVMVALHYGSLREPLDSRHGALFERLFARVMGDPFGDSFAHGVFREPWRGASDELLEIMRNRFSVPGRVKVKVAR